MYQPPPLPDGPCRLCGRIYARKHVIAKSCSPDCRRLESALIIWLRRQPKATWKERQMIFASLVRRGRQLLKELRAE